MHHLSKRGTVAHQIKPRCLFFHPSRCNLCLNSRCFNISFHELILSARSSRRSFPIEFLSVAIVLDEDLESKDVKINWSNESNPRERHLDREDCFGLCPSVFLPHVLN